MQKKTRNEEDLQVTPPGSMDGETRQIGKGAEDKEAELNYPAPGRECTGLMDN